MFNIETPRIIHPANGDIRVKGMFQASEYVRIGKFKLLHEKTEWEVSTDKNFVKNVIKASSEKVLKAVNVDLSEYKKTKMYVRVRYGSTGTWSDWSAPVLFTTI